MKDDEDLGGGLDRAKPAGKKIMKNDGDYEDWWQYPLLAVAFLAMAFLAVALAVAVVVGIIKLIKWAWFL